MIQRHHGSNSHSSYTHYQENTTIHQNKWKEDLLTGHNIKKGEKFINLHARSKKKSHG